MIEFSNLTKKRIGQYLSQGKRFDGRKVDEFREVKIETGVSNKAEGSAKVKIGKTEVWVGVKMDIMEPYSSNPDEGTMIVTAELLPLSHGKYEYGPPRFEAIELGRLVDRGIRESKYIDFKKLCIKEGEKAWAVLIDIYSINDDGNLLDAAFIGTLTALRDTRIPYYDEEREIIDYKKEKKEKLPLSKNMPLNYSIYEINDVIFLDPTLEEEACAEGRIIMGIVPENPIKICSMQKSNNFVISSTRFNEMLEFVEKKNKTFYPYIEKMIEEAIKKDKKI
ncbi:MAG: exosome complex protein Rrp42 [Candidatus Pacearchaeota archaeon]